MPFQIKIYGKIYSLNPTGDNYRIKTSPSNYSVVPIIDLSSYLKINNVLAGSGVAINYTLTGLTINSTGSGGGGTITGATNGLQVLGKNIGLGGNITGSTLLTIDPGASLLISGLDIKYDNDYSPFYTNRSLVDAGYVTGITSTLNPYNFLNGLDGSNSPNIKLGGTLTEAVTFTLNGGGFTYSGTGIDGTINNGQVYYRANNGNDYCTFEQLPNLFTLRVQSNTPSKQTEVAIDKISIQINSSSSDFTGIQYNASSVNYHSNTLVTADFVTGLTGAYLSKSAFNVYSASTLTNINSRLLASTFNTYSGNTANLINTKIGSANNGLTKVGTNIHLGGKLTGTTSIGLSSFNLTFTGTTGTLRYGSDFSVNYNVRSLVDKGFVTGITSALLTTSNFNTYSASTLTNINSRLLASAFNTYSGATIQTVVLGSDITNSNSVANTMQNVTGLSFNVVSGSMYYFKFIIFFTAAATTTGSRWSITGPATPTLISYVSRYSLTITTETVNHSLAAYDVPAASNASSGAIASNQAIIEGFIKPSANGTVTARFASKVASSAIVAKAGSFVQFQKLI